MVRAQSGDRRAFDDLVRVFHRGVYGYALRVLGDEDSAAEVTQETFVRAWRYRASFKPAGGGFRGWLFAIAANQIRDAHGRRARAQPVENLDDLVAGGVGGLEAYARTVLREEVLAALEGLETEQREVIALKYLSGLTYGQIAQALEISVSAAKMRALRGREILARRLARLFESDPGAA
jgi:RNA polymerase sigma-70 factor (ECF subfamily)